MKTERIELRLGPEGRGQVEALARDSGKSVSSTIRRLIAEAYRNRFEMGSLAAATGPTQIEAIRVEVGVVPASAPEQPGRFRVGMEVDTLMKFHRDVLGRDPTPAQRAIYEVGAPGLVGRHPLPEQLEAMVVVAMHMAQQGEVYVFVPRVIEAEVNVAIKTTVATAITATPAGQGHRERLKALVHRLRPWTRLPPEHEPMAWVAFGFERSDPVPAWLKQGLVAAPDPKTDLNKVGRSSPPTRSVAASS